jgi:hypothetical protein
MRVLFTSLITSSVVLIHVLDNPSRFYDGWGNIKQEAMRFLNAKEVRIEGLSIISRTEVERSLPLRKSPAWWLLNETSITAKLAENPWVREADVQSCKGSLLPKFGCFVVTVEERKPRFVATVDSERWIIGEDGAFIMPATSESLQEIPQAVLSEMVPIRGLASKLTAPERVTAQLAIANSTIEILEKTVQLPIRGVAFEGKSDVIVNFERVPFPVTFTATSDSSAAVEDQGRRFKALLIQLKDRLGEVEKVDLAFAKVGVVKFKGGS